MKTVFTGSLQLNIIITTFVLLSIPLALFSLQHQQDSRSRAALTSIAPHPRTVVNSLELAEVKRRIAAGIEPQKSAYAKLIAEANTALTLTPAPPATMDIIGGYDPNSTLGDVRTFLEEKNAGPTYTLALAWALSGDTKYANKAVQFLNAWATKNTTFTGADSPLQLGGYFVGMVFAYDILQTYPEYTATDKAKFKTFWYAKVVPWYLSKIDVKRNNWLDNILQGTLATGIAFEDATLSNHAITRLQTIFTGDWKIYKDSKGTYFREEVCRSDGEGCDGATSTNFIGTKGLTYTAYTLQALAPVLDMARNEGVDLWSSKTPLGGTVGEAINSYHGWNTNTSTFPWGGSAVTVNTGRLNFYEYANARGKLSAAAKTWVLSRRPVRQDHGEIWATLLKGDISLSVSETQPTYTVTSTPVNSYYVSPTGSDTNSGTITSPFKSLSYAYTKATAGTTIYVRGGTYQLSSSLSLNKSGTSSQPITIQAYQSEIPVIDGSAMTQTGYYSGWPVAITNASWNRIVGFEIKNGPMGGIVITGASHNNTLERLNVHTNGRLSQWEGKGIGIMDSSSNNLIINNDSHHNQDIPGDNADGFFICSTGSGNVLRGNRAWRNSDDGYDLFNCQDNTTSGTVLLENNYAWENGYNDAMQRLGDGNGFKLGGQRPNTTSKSGGHTVRNNIAWKNAADGFTENEANVQLSLYNNTSYNNSNYNFSAWTIAHKVKNNLSFGSSKGVLFTSSTDQSYNSWSLPVTVSTADFVSVDDTPIKATRAANGSLPISSFLHFNNTSDLLDKGVDIGFAYTGSAPDLGAYEYQPIPPSPTTTNGPTITISPSNAATTVPTPETTTLALTVFLHGIGKGGDNVNPTSTGNTNPLRTQRTVTVQIYNALNMLVGNQQGTVTYDPTLGGFKGTINMGTFISPGSAIVKIKGDHYLRRTIPGIVNVLLNAVTVIPPIALQTGDANNDNIINLLDYNLLLDCFSDLLPAKNCDATKKLQTDITDDGNVNQHDYNLFLRELSVQSGE